MSPSLRVLLHALILILSSSSVMAAGFSLNPGGIAANDPSPLTLNVTGLSAGQTVLIERFHDANGNAQIDAGEMLLLSFQVKDGYAATFGGVRDQAIPGDEDGATNGQVSTLLRLSDLPEVTRAVGSYVFRVSALDASFAPLVQPFSIQQPGHAQSVRGRVTANSAPVPGAMVAVLFAEGGGEDFAGGVFADSSGTFNLNVPAGNYMLLALKPGLLTPLPSMPQISVNAGLSVTQDIALASASRTISGRVIDVVTSNGIPGLQMFADSTSEEVGVVVTDAAGNFSFAASPAQWRVELSEPGLRLLGYSARDYVVDTTEGDVTDMVIPAAKGRGNFELVFFFPSGTFANGTNGTMAFPTQLNYYYALLNLEDVNFPTNVLFSGPSGSGLANTPSANFGANFEGDSAFYSSPQINVPPFPPGGVYTVNYKGEPIEYVLTDPQAQSRQIVLVPTVTVDGLNRVERIAWNPRDVTGNPVSTPSFISDIEIRIDGMGGRLYDTDLAPDATSHTLSEPVTWSDVSSIQMVYNDVAGNQYVSFWNRGTQPLQILTGTNLVSGTVGSGYQALFVAAGGQSPYTWSLQSGTLPPGLNFGGTGEISGNPTTAGTYNFRVRVTDSNQVFREKEFSVEIRSAPTIVRLEPVMRSPGQFQFRIAAQPGQTYTVEYSTGLSSWLPLLTTNAPSASFEVLDPFATNQVRFYRVRQ